MGCGGEAWQGGGREVGCGNSPGFRSGADAMSAPRVLLPFDRREAITVGAAANITGRAERTIRDWCEAHHLGRRIGGSPWIVSRVALAMFLDGDEPALAAYLAGDRSS